MKLLARRGGKAVGAASEVHRLRRDQNPHTPPEPRSCRRLHGTQNCRQRRRVSARRDADRRRADNDLDRRGPATRVRPNRGRRSPKGFLDNDRGEGRSARCNLVVRGPSPRPPLRFASPTKELLRRQPAAPRDGGNLLPARVAFGEDLPLLSRGPRPAPTGAGKHLQPTHRFRIGFGQKLSVRHVSNPLDSTGSTFADLRSALKVRSKGRLRQIVCTARLRRASWACEHPIQLHRRVDLRRAPAAWACEHLSSG